MAPYSTVLLPAMFVHHRIVMVVARASGFWMNGPRVRVCAEAEAATSRTSPATHRANTRTSLTENPPQTKAGRVDPGPETRRTIHGSRRPMEGKIPLL